jgi:Domain of unknown function (DUF4326)
MTTQQLAIDIKLGTITLLNKYHLDCPDQSLNFEIMRPSPLGNPYHLKSKQHPDGHTRDEVCDFFERDLKQQIRSRGTDPETEVQGGAFFEVIKLAKLVREGKQITITCCCKPKRCHGESIVRAVMWLAADPQWETYCVPFIEENTSVEVEKDSDESTLRGNSGAINVDSSNVEHPRAVVRGIDTRSGETRSESIQLCDGQAVECRGTSSKSRTDTDNGSSVGHPRERSDRVVAGSSSSEPKYSKPSDEQSVTEALSLNQPGVNEDERTKIPTSRRRKTPELRVPLHSVGSEPVAGADHVASSSSTLRQSVDTIPTFTLNQIVEWRECPDYLKDFRYTRVRAILPDENLLLGFIRNPVKASDCEPLAEDHPGYEKAVQFWKMYSPVVG